jgi:hypothetical protein
VVTHSGILKGHHPALEHFTKSALQIAITGSALHLVALSGNPHQALWRGIIMRWRNSRNRHSTLLVVGTCLGVYVVLAVCIHWLTQPAIVTAYGVTASSPPPTTAVVSSDARFVTPVLQPSAVPSEQPTSAPSRFATVPLVESAPKVVENSAVAPKKAPKNRVARTGPRRERPIRERRNPMWDYASGSYNGNRPRF